MDVDSIPSPVISFPYLVTHISNNTLSPNCESSLNSSPRQSSLISDIATRRFPLTAALAKNALTSEKNIRAASPSPDENRIEESTLDMFEYYNSRGELVIPAESLLPPRIYMYSPTCPPPYDALGYFHIICPIQPPKTTPSSSRVPTRVSQPLPTVPRIPTKVARSVRLCKTKDCNAIIPFKHYKWQYCKRCTDRIYQPKTNPYPRHGSNPYPSPSTSVAPQLPDSRLNARDNSCPGPSFTIPTSSRRPKPLPLPARSTTISTVRSVSESGSRISTLSGATDTSKTSHSSNVAPNGANIESVTIGKKRSRCVTEPILASTSTAEPSTALTVKEAPEPTRLNPPTLPSISCTHPRCAEPHIPPQSRSSHTTKRKPRPLRKPTPVANPLVSSSSVPALAPAGPVFTIPSENAKLSDPWLLRITAGTEQRKCITPCTNMIPLSSSPYTLRCPSCVKADWIARKRGVESLMQESRAMKTTANSEMDEKEDEKEELRAKRQDAGSSIDSLLSLSSFEEDDEEPEAQLNAAFRLSELDPIPSLAPTPTLKIALKFPAEMWRKVRNLRYCSEDGCCKQLTEGYDESICVRCQAKRRERKRVFGVSCTAVWGMRGIFGDLQGLRSVKDDEGEETMGDIIQGARLCAVRWCSHVLPTKEEYKWSMCLGCRSYLVKRDQPSVQEGEEKKGEKKVWGGKLTSRTNADGAEWRCSSLDCGMLVGDKEQERRPTSLCVQCIRRKAREAERVELVRAMTGKATSSSSNKPDQEEAPTKPHSTCKGSYYPEFISFSALIAQFRAELHSFLRDQAQLALRRRCVSIEHCESSTSACSTTPPTKPPATGNVAHTPTLLGPLFTFKGQSSTVCSTPNVLGPSHRTAILSHLVYVRSELERASLLQLRPENSENPLVVFKEGFAVKFVCMHTIPLGWFLSGEPDANNEKQRRESETGAGDVRKDIKGELDIIVFPDHSHHILPGQTTMIKFRMGVINFS